VDSSGGRIRSGKLSSHPRIIARKLGLETYDSGKPCKSGHISHKRVDNAMCLECNKENRKSSRKKPYREWSEDRKLKKRHYHRISAARRRAKSTAERLAKIADYRENRAKALASGEKTYIGAPCRNGHGNVRRVNGKGECVECGKTIKSNSVAKRRGATGRVHLDDIEWLWKNQKGKCPLCSYPIRSTDKRDLDHILPVSKGGPHIRSNLQITHATCNRRKSNKDPIEHAQKVLGRLL